ncbi:uncharacterized protein [Mytilus edulis]|uniref:uncharacterized protein n=1 Tax=Mytilus edulis TaxID=6550 RepID=UPI0039F0E423
MGDYSEYSNLVAPKGTEQGVGIFLCRITNSIIFSCQNFSHIHIWTGAVQPRYSENIYDVDKCEEVDYFVVDTDVIANNSYSVCVSLDSDNPGQYFLENCEENNHFVCIDHGDAITTDGLFESLSSYTTFGDYNTETHDTPRFEDCIYYCKTRIECFASVFDSNIGDCRIMLDNTYNFLTRYELIVPYSNEPDPFGIFSLYVKTTRVHIELQNVTDIYQESFPCNFEYGYLSSTGTITETGIMETTIGDEENSNININDITTQQTSSKEIITTQELNSEEIITTQNQNSEDARMTQRPNPQESTTTEEIFSEDTSTTRDHNSEKRTTTEEQTYEDKSTTKRPTSDEITASQILESEERQTTQEINSEERIRRKTNDTRNKFRRKNQKKDKRHKK